MLFEINELEEALLQDGQVVPVDIKNRIAVLRDFARTYDALLELVELSLPRTYEVMFEDEGEIIINETIIISKNEILIFIHINFFPRYCNLSELFSPKNFPASALPAFE